MKLSGISNKDQRDYVRKLTSEGWSVEVTNGAHILLTSPRGSRIHAALTSSSRNYVRRLRGRVERTLKKEKQLCP